MMRLSLPLCTLVLTGSIFVISACSTFDDVEEVRLVDLLDGIEGPGDVTGDAEIDLIDTDVIVADSDEVDEADGIDEVDGADEIDGAEDATELIADTDATDTDATPCLPRASVDVTCDHQDDDCDGQVDEDYVPIATCGLGVCLATSLSSTCIEGVETPCTPGAAQSASDARCNGIDEDCDGFMDENGSSACGVGQLCNQGQCECPGNATQCSGACVNQQTDPANCGGCGTACSVGQVCNLGHCGSTCNTWLEDCDGACVKLDEDPDHCGACGVSCTLAHTEASCFGGQCAIGACQLGYGDADGLASNGCECEQTNGGVELCDGVDQDCDGVVDNAEPASLANNALHCGACDAPCPAGEATEFATCSGGLCGFEGCPAGWWDGDDDPTNGCEYACAQTAGGVEICDGVDNDCDGEVDEDFDLQRDVENCGGCGVVCASLGGNAVWDCSLGACGIDQCEPQYFDINRDVTDGCEYFNAAAGEIWVDAWGGDDNYAGNQAFPVKTITRGLEMANEYDTIRIQPGTYLETISITTPNVSLVGNGVSPSEVTILNGSATTTVSIDTNAVSMRNLRVSGGTRGIVIANCDGCQILDCAVADVSAVGLDAVGVEISLASNVIVKGTSISDVQGYTDSLGRNPGDGVGISMVASTGIGIDACSIANIKGADVSYHDDGGNGFGLYLEETTGALITSNTIGEIRGGKGGSGYAYGCGTGGRGVAFFLSGIVTGNTFSGNVATDIFGGLGGINCGSGPMWTGSSNVGVGFFLSSNFSNTISETNVLNGTPIQFYSGQAVVDIQNHVLDYGAGAIPFEIAAIVVVDVDSVAINGNTISSFTGVAGGSYDSAELESNAIKFSAVYVQGVSGACAIGGNTIAHGIGGRGGHLPTIPGTFVVGRGASISGIEVHEAACDIVANEIMDLTAGSGGYGTNNSTSPYKGKGGIGGTAIGVEMLGDNSNLVGNRISALVAGDGGDSWGAFQPGWGGNGGDAVGVSVGAAAISLENNFIYEIAGGERGVALNKPETRLSLAGKGVGVEAGLGADDLVILNTVVSDVSPGTGSAGVLSLGGAGLVLVKNSILTSSSGFCVHNEAANAPSTFAYQDTLLFGCGAGAVFNATLLGTNLLNQDPLFVDPTNGDFHLTCNSAQCSPAVDAGDLASDYSLEPSPNGCRVNMGAYGNTAEAATDPNATHCP